MHHKLRCRVQVLKLRNHGLYCYANSSFLSILWAVMTRLQFALDDLGQMATSLVELLLCYDGSPTLLVDIPFLQPIMRKWAEQWDTRKTADSAEFTHFLMGFFFTQVTNVCLHWERREADGDDIAIVDKSAEQTPTMLHLSHGMLHQEHVTLQELLHIWRQVDGRVTAFLRPSQLLCLQIQRHIETADGVKQYMHPVKFANHVLLPVFLQQNSLEYLMEPYIVISATCHEGNDVQGHYQTLMRSKTAPGEWYVKDDGGEILVVDAVPSWCERGVSTLWLCHAEQWLEFCPDEPMANETTPAT